MVGVVLVNYHTDEQIYRIAEYYGRSELVKKIVIVHNDSASDSKMLNSTGKIEEIFIAHNPGYGGGNNIGICRFAEDDEITQIVISNSDIAFSLDILEKMTIFLKEHREYGAVAPRMLDWNGKPVPLRKGELDAKWLFRKMIFINPDRGLNAEIEKKPWVDQTFLPGSFFMADKDALIRSHMFDENVFLYREEEILGKRLSAVGYKEAVLMNLQYQHQHIYTEESLEHRKKRLRMEIKSEKYYFRTYKNYSCVQMALLSIWEEAYYFSRMFSKYIKQLKYDNAVKTERNPDDEKRNESE